MKSINTQNCTTSQSTFQLITNLKRTNWNNRRRYSSSSQLRFI
ncbi:hypothetical protein [uncultured Lutibacter sp.]|nr:hypothetical protein [uncultured Lutibacter sp.]